MDAYDNALCRLLFPVITCFKFCEKISKYMSKPKPNTFSVQAKTPFHNPVCRIMSLVCHMGDFVIGHMLSYIAQPQLLSVLCSVCGAWNLISFSPCVWCGVIVDTANFKPVGAKTRRHYDMWLHSLAVVTHGWMTTTIWFTKATAYIHYRWYMAAPPRLAIFPSRTRTSSWKTHRGR